MKCDWRGSGVVTDQSHQSVANTQLDSRSTITAYISLRGSGVMWEGTGIRYQPPTHTHTHTHTAGRWGGAGGAEMDCGKVPPVCRTEEQQEGKKKDVQQIGDSPSPSHPVATHPRPTPPSWLSLWILWHLGPPETDTRQHAGNWTAKSRNLMSEMWEEWSWSWVFSSLSGELQWPLGQRQGKVCKLISLQTATTNRIAIFHNFGKMCKLLHSMLQPPASY